MTGPFAPRQELGLLAAALCDGQITPAEAARLEELVGRSSHARRFFLHYVQLHGELLWEHAASLETSAPLTGAGRTRLGDARSARRWTRLRAWAAWTAAAVAVVLAIGITWRSFHRHQAVPVAQTPPTAAAVAHLSRTVGVRWENGQSDRQDGSEIHVGEGLLLAEGLAEITFGRGARVILRGPAGFHTESVDSGLLQRGSLTASVSPEAHGFTVHTPGATVVDLGTEFGVAVEKAGGSVVEVFSGEVLVHSGAYGMRPAAGATAGWKPVRKGQALRVHMPTADRAAEIEEVPAGSQGFVRTLPPPGAGSVADLRRLAREHPHLIHHYTFEGGTPVEQLQDRRGTLHLTEAVMQGGRGGGELVYGADGFDGTTLAVQPFRSRWSGNESGVGLQTETAFPPPPAMTIELLLNFIECPGQEDGLIAAAVATRSDERRCGFFVVAVDTAQLTHLMDSEAPWIETEGNFSFQSGDWYYLASTFRTAPGKTTVNTYVANLTRGQRTLDHVVKDRELPGTPATSRLGIGKAFNENTAHAYPWSGSLDEIAIYDATLDQRTLTEHLHAVTGVK